jgi:hypothetical protein
MFLGSRLYVTGNNSPTKEINIEKKGLNTSVGRANEHNISHLHYVDGILLGEASVKPFVHKDYHL